MIRTILIGPPHLPIGMASKKILYVGGLAEEVNEKTIHAGFVVFGDVIDVNISIDYASGQHRGFGLIIF